MGSEFKPFVPDLEIIDNRDITISVKKMGEVGALFNPIVATYNGKFVWCKSRDAGNCVICPFYKDCPRPNDATRPLEGKEIKFEDLPNELQMRLEETQN